jgi:glutamine synthetase
MALNCAKAEDVLKTIKDQKVQMIDLRFTDLPGVWQHFSVPPSAVDADALDEGIGFDGSSIRGFQEIQESDMLVVPDPTTAFADARRESLTQLINAIDADRKHANLSSAVRLFVLGVYRDQVVDQIAEGSALETLGPPERRVVT